ncbi:MAG: methyltransferase [Vicinamibacteria bacterium]|nr:methyltransferase [Vicinamibacteria bacterium]
MTRNDFLTRAPTTDPTWLYRTRDGIYAADLLVAAITHLDLFAWMATQEAASLDAVCERFALARRPADVLLTLTTAMGLTTRDDDVFRLTPTAREHLVQSSPWCLVPYYSGLGERPQVAELLRVLRTGKPAHWGSDRDGDDWARSMKRPEFAARFTDAMDCRGIHLGRALAARLDLASHARLLDVAGGSGIYSCCLVARHPHLRATVLEKPPVDRAAREAIARQGQVERIDVIASDMLAGPFPGGYDIHLMSNVLHDWDEPIVRDLLGRSSAALPSGGLLVIHDAHLDADKTGPLPVAQYSVLLMHSTEGRGYSVGEMTTWLGEKDFIVDWHGPTTADRGVIVARRT